MPLALGFFVNFEGAERFLKKMGVKMPQLRLRRCTHYPITSVSTSVRPLQTLFFSRRKRDANAARVLEPLQGRHHIPGSLEKHRQRPLLTRFDPRPSLSTSGPQALWRRSSTLRGSPDAQLQQALEPLLAVSISALAQAMTEVEANSQKVNKPAPRITCQVGFAEVFVIGSSTKQS